MPRVAVRWRSPALTLWLAVAAALSQVAPTRGSDEAAPPLEESAPVRSIPLQKQYVPVVRDGKTVAYKTAYFGTVRVGAQSEQVFTVVFDTGSGHLILPSTACGSATCSKHQRYNRTQSGSAVDIEYDGTLIRPGATERDQVAIAFGTGEVRGEFVREVVCLGAESPPLDAAGAADHGCVTLRTVLATEMTEDPFGLFAFDGVLGLGLEALTLAPQFSFFAQLSAQRPGLRPYFAVFLARSDGGESMISFGGHDARRASSAFQWAPVAMKELGYWQVQIKRVLVGQTVLEDCADGACRAIVDTGTSLIGVPRQSARSLHRMLARPVKEDTYADAPQIDCRTVPGHKLRFELADGLVVDLDVEDYSRPTPFNMTLANTKGSQLFCRSLLLPVDMPAPLGPKVFIWGEPVLRRYYTLYDLAEKRVGFALAHEPDPDGRGRSGLPAVGAPPAGSLVSGAPLAPLPAARRQQGATGAAGADAAAATA